MDIEDDSDTNDIFQKNQVPSMDLMYQKAPVMFNRPPPKLFAPNAMQSGPSDFNESNDTNDRGTYSMHKINCISGPVIGSNICLKYNLYRIRSNESRPR